MGVAKNREKSKKGLTFRSRLYIFLAKTVPISAVPSEARVQKREFKRSTSSPKLDGTISQQVLPGVERI
jgi:hypothetical protein